MKTTTRERELLSDEVWSQIPRASADRRVVGAVLLLLLLTIPAAIVGNSTGVLVPRLSYEGGRTTVHATTHTLGVGLIIHNRSSRAWEITGATIEAPGALRAIQMRSVNIAAHHTRTIEGVIHIDACAAVAAWTSDQLRGFAGDIKLRVRRLLGTSTVTAHDVFDAQMIFMACAK